MSQSVGGTLLFADIRHFRRSFALFAVILNAVTSNESGAVRYVYCIHAITVESSPEVTSTCVDCSVKVLRVIALRLRDYCHGDNAIRLR